MRSANLAQESHLIRKYVSKMIVQVEIFLNQMELVNNVHHIWFQMLAQQNVVNNAR